MAKDGTMNHLKIIWEEKEMKKIKKIFKDLYNWIIKGY